MTDQAADKPKPASAFTLEANARVADALSLDDLDFERASRGLLATHETGKITHKHGTAWDVSRYDFIRNNVEPPESVNPSLWRQARLNSNHGLFEVADGMWQARGYDISNITFLRGDTGWVIIDPLTTEATAAACLELANATLGHRDVRAVIYTHSHADHFGGVEGVTSHDAVRNGEVRVIAPEGFLREAVSENVIAGPAMARRAAYQFGPLLPPGPRGHVDSGLGQAIPTAPSGLIAPTEDITHTGQQLTVDGIRIVFQMTPEAEAPAEMNFFFPDRGGCAWPRTAATTCTIWFRFAVPKFVTRSTGPSTSTKRSSCLVQKPN
ncbi:MAG: alkyl sulfatase BDS1-like metallo-beta-lactamase superfamily hydrolase [Acidimicrobiales bacterium]|jgi:alkyl sulfatase BDS1-like metallo-beta-lactamase superfamily hydrolase